MTRKFQILAVVIATLSLQFSYAVAQDERGTQESLVKTARSSAIPLPAVVAVPTPSVLGFHSAAVGIASSSAQKLTVSFKVSGYSGSFTPTAAMHYGYDYKLGAVSCVVSGGMENCKVTVTFIPTLPGGRKDALLLLDGTTTLSTVLVGGTGQSPLALIQPGIVTTPVNSGSAYYIYQSVVDENGTV